MVKSKKPPVIFALFSGLGFLDLGFENAGFPVVYANELEQHFVDGARYARQKMGIKEPKYGYHVDSVEKLLEGKDYEYLKSKMKEARSEGESIGFIAGPPCPDFSIAGKNRGHTGENGKLSRTYFKLIIKLQPDFFLFENVKGLYRTKKHREFFEEMKKQAIESDYVLTERLINTLEYGVPQYRERIILLGFKRDYLKKQGVVVPDDVTFMPDGMFPWSAFIKYDAKAVFAMKWPTKTPFQENKEFKMPNGIIEELAVEHWFKKNKVDGHENSLHSFQPKAGLARFMVVEEGDDSRKSYKRLHRWRYSPTAAYGNNEVHLHPYKARRLSVAEVLAVQSLPNNFALPKTMTLTDMFKGVGNGVPYIAAHAIAKSVLKFIGGEK